MFFEYFKYNIQINDELRLFFETHEQDIQQNNIGSNSEILYRFFSKLEKIVLKFIFAYYEIATFISGVLLKANIFTSFCFFGFGDGFTKSIKDIMEQRNVPKMYFNPIYLERIK